MVPKETPWAPREALKDAKNVLRRSQKDPKGSLKGTKITYHEGPREVPMFPRARRGGGTRQQTTSKKSVPAGHTSATLKRGT